jgi:hypothetical protein
MCRPVSGPRMLVTSTRVAGLLVHMAISDRPMRQLLIGPRVILLEVVTLVVDVILAARFLENATSRRTSVIVEMTSTEAGNGCRDAVCHVVQPHEVFCDETKRYGCPGLGRAGPIRPNENPKHQERLRCFPVEQNFISSSMTIGLCRSFFIGKYDI